MLLEEMKSVRSEATHQKVRKFALTMTIVLAAIGLYFLWKERAAGQYFLIGGGVLLVIGTISPSFLRPFYVAWMSLAVVMGFVMSRVVLSLVFYLVFSPVGIVTRILRKDLLKERIDPERRSYWIQRERGESTKQRAERQF